MSDEVDVPTIGPYEVVLLVEQTMTAQDAVQVRSLHEGLQEDGQDPVHYTVLHPAEDAAIRIESAMGALGTPGDLVPTGLMLEETDVAEMEKEALRTAQRDLDASVRALRDAGARADGTLLTADPVDGLVSQARAVGAAEVIVLTSPHLVREFFGVDWTSRARRKLDVPTLHLIEHETFDEQAESYGGEGITGL